MFAIFNSNIPFHGDTETANTAVIQSAPTNLFFNNTNKTGVSIEYAMSERKNHETKL